MRDMKWLPNHVSEDAIEENSLWLVTNYDKIDLNRVRKVGTAIVAKWLKELQIVRRY